MGMLSLLKGKWRDFNENLVLHVGTLDHFDEIVIGVVRVINSSPFRPREVVSDSNYWQFMECKNLGFFIMS